MNNWVNGSSLKDGEQQPGYFDWSTSVLYEQCIPHWFEAQVARYPDKIALVLDEQQLSYGALDRRANALAQYLCSLGVGPEVAVGLCVERSFEMIIGLLAILKAGGAYVPLDPSYPQERLDWMLQDAHIGLLLTHARWRERFTWQDYPVVSIEPDRLREPERDGPPTVSVNGENLAYIIYTSGSTGRPKGVMVTENALVNFTRSALNCFALQLDDRVLQFASPSFDASAAEIFSTLIAGATLVLRPNIMELAPLHLLQFCEHTHLTVLHLPPAYWTQLFEDVASACLPFPPAVRLGSMGGEQMPVSKLLQWVRYQQRPACFLNAGGATEVTIASTYYNIPMEPETIARHSSIPAGHPIEHVQLLILDEQLQPVPPGSTGELYIGGAGLARGYLHCPDLTAERFVPHPFSTLPGARLYRTGDLARFLPDGSLDYCGRLDHQVKIRGHRIEPAEIETALLQHPAVRDALVLAPGSAAEEHRLVAYLIRQEQGTPSSDELRHYLLQKIPAYMVPAAYIWLERFPLNTSGKIDRHALPLPQERPTLTVRYEEPRTEAEQTLARVWAEVLGLKSIGIHDNFFDLGGNSLAATRMIARISALFRCSLSIRDFFTRATIVELARLLPGDTTETVSSPPITIPRVSRDIPLPLSFSQERIWFLQHLTTNTVPYHAQGYLLLTGTLQIDALEWALNEIVRRHEIYRTTFPAVDGIPAQKVHPFQAFHLPVIDLNTVTFDERERVVQSLFDQEFRRPFDLTKLPLVRWTLVQLSQKEHMLLHVEHHIVHDGWSFQVLLLELVDLYRAFTTKASSLPDLPIQFADYACWQRKWMLSDEARQQLAHWQKTLANLPEDLTFPTDRPRFILPQFRGETKRLVLPSALYEAIRQLSRQWKCTTFSLMLASWKALLHRYTGQCDIVVGSSIANRRLPETEALIGMLVNTIALRTDLTGNPSFRELVARVSQGVLAALQYQDVPFHAIVDALHPARTLSYNPIFQVMFNFHDTPSPKVTLSDLTITPVIGLSNGSAKFDMNIVVIPPSEQRSPAEMTVLCEYNTDLYDDATIEQLLSHWQTLLHGIVADPSQRLADLPLLSPREQQRILLDWNALQIPQTSCGEVCLHHWFEAQAAGYPDKIALVLGDHQLSYGALDRRANALAQYLCSLGVGPEVAVGLCVERSFEMIIGLLAILKAGGAYVPLDPSYPQERLDWMLQDAHSALLLTHARWRERFAQRDCAVVSIEPGPERLAEQDQPPLVVVHGENLAYIIYTSGSTGRPKGVMVCHANVINFFMGMRRVIGDEEPGNWLAVTGISFDISILELLWTLTHSYRVTLQKDEIKEQLCDSNTMSPKEIAFSLFYFASDDSRDQAQDKYRLLIEGAKFADQHGFQAIWTPERHFHEFGGLYPNPALTSAAVAVITEHVHIRAGSVVLPLHNPLRVAEEWSVVDNLSRGRIGISFASGWHADDFTLMPEHYADRKEIMLREIDKVKKLWSGEPITLPSGTGNEVSVKIHPRPIQQHLPLWMTASGNPETFRLAGEMGTNVLTHLLGQNLEALAEKINLYRMAWRRSQGSPGGHVTLMLHTFIGQDLETVRAKVYTPFRNYLLTSLDLLRNLAKELGQDIDSGRNEDLDALLDYAFERYFKTSSLMGTPESCLHMIRRLQAIGVDEVACLIDFGVGDEDVIESLHHLAELREYCNRQKPLPAEDVSISTHMLRQGITAMQCTPSWLRLLTLEPSSQRALGSLRKLLVGGEVFPPALLNPFEAIPNIELYNMYGPTETTIWSTSARLDPCRAGAITIGAPIVNTQIYILDQHYQPVPIGVPGDLYIGGMGVTRGYFNQPDLTSARFLPDPFASRSGQRLYKTGDIARFLPDGSIEYLERADQQVKIRGYRIELGEIEALLEQHSAVQACVVQAVQDHAGDIQLIAYLVPTRQQSLLLEEKEQVLADHQRYLLPNGLTVAHFSDHQTRALYREIFEDQEYFRHNITLKDGDCVFDVGANIGMFSLYIHQHYTNLDIYAFEPLLPIFEVLQTNMVLHQANVTCLPYGLSDKNEQARLIFYPDMPGLSGRYSNPEEDKQIARSMLLESVAHKKMTERDQARLQQEATEIAEQHYHSQTFQCQMMMLSDIIKQYHIQQIDLLKVDVEKSELQVLLGIAEEDWPRIKQLVMEIHNATLLDAVYSLLAQHGYIIHVDELPLGKASRQLSDMHMYLLYAIHPSRDVGSSTQRILATPTSALLVRNELQRYLEAYLPKYMVPSAFIVLDALPRTLNNKIDRKALPAPDERLLLTHPSDERFVPPLTPLEEELAQIWSALLRGQRVGRHDNFFRLGGHSLVAMQLIARINTVYQIELPLRTLFQNPSIAQLADAITRSKMEQYSPEELTTLLSTIDQMSEEEARSLLDE